MKLYFSTGACALASQIVLRETGAQFDLVKVDLKTKKSPEGDFRLVNPKGYIPVLALDNGEILTEGTAILQYVADLKPEKKLMPAFGSFERYRAVEWLNFISTEMHKGVGALFDPAITEEGRALVIERLQWKFEFLEQHLAKNQYLMGAAFTAPDAYLFNILTWPGYVKMDISKYGAVNAYMERVAARPTVHAAMEAEGLKAARH